ncbi:MAG: hypothetical protein ABIS06_17425 [Vicinamibacterales bacterium]
MPNNPFLDILAQLQSTGFRDVAGARVSAVIPVSEQLIDGVIAASIPATAPVRAVNLRAEPGDRFSVRISPRSSFLPSLTLKLQIVRQPELPGSPLLVLRMATMGGLMGFAGAAFPIGSMLPPGVRLDGQHILVDLYALAAQRGLTEVLGYVRQLRVTTGSGHVVVEVEAGIGSAP